MNKKYVFRANSITALNEALKELSLCEKINILKNPLLEADGTFTSLVQTEKDLNKKNIKNVEVEDQEKQNKKEELTTKAIDAIKNSLDCNSELQSILNQIHKLNQETEIEVWKINPEKNTATLKNKDAQIFRQNDNICLSYKDKIHVFKTVKELHDFLTKNNLPLPRGISLKEDVQSYEKQKVYVIKHPSPSGKGINYLNKTFTKSYSKIKIEDDPEETTCWIANDNDNENNDDKEFKENLLNELKDKLFKDNHYNYLLATKTEDGLNKYGYFFQIINPENTNKWLVCKIDNTSGEIRTSTLNKKGNFIFLTEEDAKDWQEKCGWDTKEQATLMLAHCTFVINHVERITERELKNYSVETEEIVLSDENYRQLSDIDTIEFQSDDNPFVSFNTKDNDIINKLSEDSNYNVIPQNVFYGNTLALNDYLKVSIPVQYDKIEIPDDINIVSDETYTAIYYKMNTNDKVKYLGRDGSVQETLKAFFKNEDAAEEAIQLYKEKKLHFDRNSIKIVKVIQHNKYAAYISNTSNVEYCVIKEANSFDLHTVQKNDKVIAEFDSPDEAKQKILDVLKEKTKAINFPFEVEKALDKNNDNLYNKTISAHTWYSNKNKKFVTKSSSLNSNLSYVEDNNKTVFKSEELLRIIKQNYISEITKYKLYPIYIKNNEDKIVETKYILKDATNNRILNSSGKKHANLYSSDEVINNKSTVFFNSLEDLNKKITYYEFLLETNNKDLTLQVVSTNDDGKSWNIGNSDTELEKTKVISYNILDDNNESITVLDTIDTTANSPDTQLDEYFKDCKLYKLPTKDSTKKCALPIVGDLLFYKDPKNPNELKATKLIKNSENDQLIDQVKNTISALNKRNIILTTDSGFLIDNISDADEKQKQKERIADIVMSNLQLFTTIITHKPKMSEKEIIADKLKWEDAQLSTPLYKKAIRLKDYKINNLPQYVIAHGKESVSYLRDVVDQSKTHDYISVFNEKELDDVKKKAIKIKEVTYEGEVITTVAQDGETVPQSNVKHYIVYIAGLRVIPGGKFINIRNISEVNELKNEPDPNFVRSFKTEDDAKQAANDLLEIITVSSKDGLLYNEGSISSQTREVGGLSEYSEFNILLKTGDRLPTPLDVERYEAEQNRALKRAKDAEQTSFPKGSNLHTTEKDAEQKAYEKVVKYSPKENNYYLQYISPKNKNYYLTIAGAHPEIFSKKANDFDEYITNIFSDKFNDDVFYTNTERGLDIIIKELKSLYPKKFNSTNLIKSRFTLSNIEQQRNKQRQKINNEIRKLKGPQYIILKNTENTNEPKFLRKDFKNILNNENITNDINKDSENFPDVFLTNNVKEAYISDGQISNNDEAFKKLLDCVGKVYGDLITKSKEEIDNKLNSKDIQQECTTCSDLGPAVTHVGNTNQYSLKNKFYNLINNK